MLDKYKRHTYLRSSLFQEQGGHEIVLGGFWFAQSWLPRRQTHPVCITVPSQYGEVEAIEKQKLGKLDIISPRKQLHRAKSKHRSIKQGYYELAIKLAPGLFWWLSGKEPMSLCQCRRHRFNPWSGKIPHAAGQLSPCTTTIKPVLWNLGVKTTEALGPQSLCPAREKPPQGDAHA